MNFRTKSLIFLYCLSFSSLFAEDAAQVEIVPTASATELPKVTNTKRRNARTNLFKITQTHLTKAYAWAKAHPKASAGTALGLSLLGIFLTYSTLKTKIPSPTPPPGAPPTPSNVPKKFTIPHPSAQKQAQTAAQAKALFDAIIAGRPAGFDLSKTREKIGFESPGIPGEIVRLGFCNYTGVAAKVLGGGTRYSVQASLPKQIAEQLGFWETPNNTWITEGGHSKIKIADMPEAFLTRPGTKILDRDKIITISSLENPYLEAAYGKGSVTMTLEELVDFAKSTQIYCAKNLLPKTALAQIYQLSQSCQTIEEGYGKVSKQFPQYNDLASGIVIRSSVAMLTQDIRDSNGNGRTAIAGRDAPGQKLSAVSPALEIYSIVAPVLRGSPVNAILATESITTEMFLGLFQSLVVNGVDEFYANAIGLGAYINGSNPHERACAGYTSFKCMFQAAEQAQEWAKKAGKKFPTIYYATFGRDPAIPHPTLSGGADPKQPSFPEIFDALKAAHPDLPVYRLDYNYVSAASDRKTKRPDLKIGMLNAGNQSCQGWIADLGSGYRQFGCSAAEEYLGAHCAFSIYNRLLERLFTLKIIDPATDLPVVQSLPWALEKILELDTK